MSLLDALFDQDEDSGIAVALRDTHEGGATVVPIGSLPEGKYLRRIDDEIVGVDIAESGVATAVLDTSETLVPIGSLPEGKWLRRVSGEIVGQDISQAVIADPATAFAWSSNAASLNVAAGHNFAASNTLTGNSTLTLAGGVDGCQGMIFVKQDATGGRTLAFTIAGRTVRKDLNVPDTNPLATANAETVYQYFYYTLAGTPCVMLNKVYLA